jgi:N-acetylglucosaminyl-diphospho-decaprenol L-rhamnosyltransferase
MNGILIVTYNSEEVVGPCLDSCRGKAEEIVVVDNASSDGTRDELLRRPWVRTILNDANRGFAGAVNQGFEVLRADCVLLLNPDIELQSGVDSLAKSFDDPEVGAATGRLIDVDGASQDEFHLRRLPSPSTLALEVLGVNRLWPGNPVNRAYRSGASGVEQPAGAFLMVRRSVWRELGGFDESFYPIWFEDVDFCKRLKENNWRVAFEPAVVARHVGGHSTSALSCVERQTFWYASLLRYAANHYTPVSRSVVCLAVMLACPLRMLASVVGRRSLEPVVAFGKVFWLAAHCLVSGRLKQSREATRPAEQLVRQYAKYP